MDTVAFYSLVAGLSFTLLGLWWVACQSRASWLRVASGRRMAYVVSLHFILPGVMALFSLIAPDASVLWRLTFAISGAVGTIGAGLTAATLRLHGAGAGRVRLLQWVAVPLYLIVAGTALAPDVVSAVGIGLAPLQVEGAMLTLLVLLGTQSAWIVTFSEVEPAALE